SCVYHADGFDTDTVVGPLFEEDDGERDGETRSDDGERDGETRSDDETGEQFDGHESDSGGEQRE
ncbi:MAG: hypothetical protein ABEH80_05865, partial [Halobaculum sp.]